MFADNIHRTELLVLLLLMLAAALTTMARRFQTPYPIVLVIAGLILSFVPGLPKVTLSSDVVLLILLPPLLFAAATNTAWRDFRFHLVSILMLAFGLVGFTVLGVSVAAEWLLPGFDWRIGLALGAVVSTTDAIAATSIASRMGLPQRIIDVLEGESLVNDASGLLALEFAIALVTTGERPTLMAGILQLLLLLGGGIVVGLVVAWVAHFAQKRIIDPPIEITISLVVPYIAYLLSEQLHVSGALAVVVCGLYMGRKNSELYTTRARLEGMGVWNTLDFVLNGTVFIMIGLQMRSILSDIHTMSHRTLILDAVIVSLVVIGLRLLWAYPGATTAFLIRKYLLHQKVVRPTIKSSFIVGWTGMRGVIALAAALSLPLQLDNGDPFPQRSLIIFLTYSVILATLVVQGLTLPPIIRALGLSEEKNLSQEEERARHMMLTAAIEHLDKLERKDAEQQSAWDDIARHYQQRLSRIAQKIDGKRTDASNALTRELQHSRLLSRELRKVERETLQHMHEDEQINDAVLRKLERELDLLDARSSSHA